VFVRIVDGDIPFTSSTRLAFMASGASVTPIELGYFIPQMHTIGTGDKLCAGEVGYIATGLKDVRFAKVGDTITLDGTVVTPLAGYKEPKPMVFLSLFPINSEEFSYARETLEKLRLSDSAFTFRPISSLALGNGFHCGFLGLLHAEIVQERLSREFDLNMIATAPSVEYLLKPVSDKAHLKIDSEGFAHIQSATEYPDPTLITEVREPIMNVTIYTPKRYVGPIMQLAQEKRGTYVDLKYQAEQAEFTYRIPLSEMIIDFFDRLKSITEGYASLDYEFFDYQSVDVAKIDILVNKEKVDALSFLVVRDQAHLRSIEITDRLAAVIPRQQFEVPIQAAIGGKVVARSDVKAFRKDVIAKLYGGDRTRKDKLLKKQKKGKSRMKLIGKVQIPQSAFFEVLKRE
jgi:GTP-binding protein LepA